MAPDVPDALGVPLADEPEVEPVAEPLELELGLVPYGSLEELLDVALPIVTFVRMNCALELALALPVVPVVPIELASLAGVTQPVRVIVFPSFFVSLGCPHSLDVLGLVWPLGVCAAAGPATSTAVARIPITY